MTYEEFLASKRKPGELYGFKPVYTNDLAKPFQSHLCDWAIRKGHSALYEDCGLGKTLQELIWLENMKRKTNKSVLLLTPLAVSHQTVREGEKFGIECKRIRDGQLVKGINVTNYEQLHKLDPDNYSAVAADESQIIKHFDGKIRKLLTKFLSKINYRLLCTATPAPNDWIELGTSCEALGVMGRMQMLGMFFSNGGDDVQQWTLKPHAKRRYWQWVATWARAIQKPSDIGFSDDGYKLPPLKTIQHVVKNTKATEGFFTAQAKTLDEQRQERKDTIVQRCEKVREVLPKKGQSLVWCHYNQEGDLLEKMIPDSVQVAGCNSDDEKEERLNAFTTGEIKTLITKPKLGGLGMNWQNCSFMTFFPAHSFEQWYQCVRRCWRFGQQNPVTVAVVTSEAESRVIQNLDRKSRAAEEMFKGMVVAMNEAIGNKKSKETEMKSMELPSWL